MPNLKILKKAFVSVPNRSGFDKSFRNLFTAPCGTLVPILTDELIPDTTVYLDLALSAQLPPLASETFMNVNYKVEAFFVPTRLLMAGYESWLVGDDEYQGQTAVTLRAPVVQFGPNKAVPGSLLDYLGFMCPELDTTSYEMTTESVVSAFPFLAYHLIWDDWYRNSLVQKSLFYNEAESMAEGRNTGYIAANMKWFTPRQADNNYILTGNSQPFADDSDIFTLRQRNFGMDYFTIATPSAQNGKAMGIGLSDLEYSVVRANDFASTRDIEADYSAGDFNNAFRLSSDVIVNPSSRDLTSIQGSGGFTIASLRAANSMQLFLERNNIAGNRLVDYVHAHYGASLKDSIAQRPVYLGSWSQPVYSKGIYQSNPSTTNDVSTNNPFASVGARYGHAYAEGSASLVDFTAEEPGYLMVIGSLVPETNYSSGIERYLTRYVQAHSQSDMANPLLQNVGNQPIFCKELSAASVLDADAVSSGSPNKVFGYVQRYADWFTRNNQLHGLLRDGKSLQSFALQRSFNVGEDFDSDNPAYQISSRFLEIPTNFMDQVSAVNGEISEYGVWVDCFFDYKVSMPLYEFSIPSLQDPAIEHGKSFLVNRGGRRID